jgi:hypothetical protein
VSLLCCVLLVVFFLVQFTLLRCPTYVVCFYCFFLFCTIHVSAISYGLGLPAVELQLQGHTVDQTVPSLLFK